jgi:hypothetical protein
MNAPTSARRSTGRTIARRAVALHALLLALAGGAVVGATACYGKGKNAPVPVERTTLVVENRAFLDHDIYVVRSGQRIRLGTVTGNSKATFTIPASVVGAVTSLRFIADPIGAPRQPVTEEITVSPGDRVVLTIPPG